MLVIGLRVLVDIFFIIYCYLVILFFLRSATNASRVRGPLLSCYLDSDFCSVAVGTHGRIEFGDAHAGRLQRGEAAEQGIGNEPGDTLQEVAGGVHDVADHLIGFGIVDGVGDIVGESSGHDVAMHDDGHLVVVAYDALLRQHAVVGMKAQSVEGDFTVQSSKFKV